MKSKLRRIFGILAILVFLTPYVGEGLHSFEHKDSVHCSSEAKHIHTLQHHCSVCDYAPCFSILSVEEENHFWIAQISVFESFAFEKEYFPIYHSFSLLRAPPANS